MRKCLRRISHCITILFSAPKNGSAQYPPYGVPASTPFFLEQAAVKTGYAGYVYSSASWAGLWNLGTFGSKNGQTLGHRQDCLCYSAAMPTVLDTQSAKDRDASALIKSELWWQYLCIGTGRSVFTNSITTRRMPSRTEKWIFPALNPSRRKRNKNETHENCTCRSW